MSIVRRYIAIMLTVLLIFSVANIFVDTNAASAANIEKVLDLDMGEEGNILTDKSGNGYDAAISVDSSTAPAAITRVRVRDDIVFDNVYCRDFMWKTNNSTKTLTYAMIGDLSSGTTLSQQLNSDVTVAFWVYMASDGSGNILTCNSDKFKIRDEVSGGKHVIYFKRSFDTGISSWKMSSSSQYFSSNAWTHVAVTYSPVNVATAPKIYINGASVSVGRDGTAPTASENEIAMSGWPVILGNQYDTTNTNYQWNRTFKGRIGSMKVFNGILSAAELSTQYTNERDDFTGWKYETKIFKGNTQIGADNYNSIPVGADKINIILQPQGTKNIDMSTVNNNITLVNTDTGVTYRHTGEYDPGTKTFSITDFGYLEYGTNYQAIIGNNIKYTDGSYPRSAPQVISFKTVPGMSLTGKSYTNATGNPITTLVGQSHANVTYQVRNYLGATKKAQLVAVLFKGDFLVDIASVKKDVANNAAETLTCGFDLPADVDQGGYKIKTFLCDDITTLYVYSNSSEFQ